ncbi:hypothetical protein TRAPUB_6448 [Trametes pubescens]|uniref:Uncharacterized protein n=1 Tax=Trametes pubescens TaxID=154538 RepID=A0A1M2V5U6_TRAPU|nr:hypothetical protein TRAPUB_6448 [Trametes pubescens]
MREDNPTILAGSQVSRPWRDVLTRFRLTLSAIGPRAEIPDVPFARVCIALLANVPTTLRTPTLAIREVRVHVWQIESAEMLRLSELGFALIRRFARLERVEVMVKMNRNYLEGVDMAGIALAVSEAMPKLQARGTLAVVEWDRTSFKMTGNKSGGY